MPASIDPMFLPGDITKYPKKFPNGLYNWVRKLEG